jgi:hypothetical protein
MKKHKGKVRLDPPEDPTEDPTDNPDLEDMQDFAATDHEDPPVGPSDDAEGGETGVKVGLFESGTMLVTKGLTRTSPYFQGARAFVLPSQLYSLSSLFLLG